MKLLLMALKERFLSLGHFGAVSQRATGGKPYFRNDDVCWDTPLEEFRAFCAIFVNHGFRQLHGVTIFGKTVVRPGPDGRAGGPYDGYPDLCDLDNDTIRWLSTGFPFSERQELIAYLRSSPDDIALHGLYHTDYAAMSPQEQRREMSEGLALLRELFPEKQIRFFIAPFNRIAPETAQVCRELGLELLAGDGVHLEAELPRLRLRPGVWYRYHHHRFYPESTFDYYRLSLPLLDRALGRGGRR
jgi:hypothetical protein